MSTPRSEHGKRHTRRDDTVPNARRRTTAALSPTDLQHLETAFVKIANRFGQNHGIEYHAWREAGVQAAVLKKAGIARTRDAPLRRIDTFRSVTSRAGRVSPCGW
jgi:hypothetical protein